ncbi:MAG: hypothetical protein ABSH08_04675 [Tepidisphaeraceae bacterium]
MHLALAKVRDVGCGQTKLDDAFFKFAAERLDDKAIHIPTLNVSGIAERPLRLRADNPARFRMGIGHDAADDSASVRGDGVECEPDSACVRCRSFQPPFPHIFAPLSVQPLGRIGIHGQHDELRAKTEFRLDGNYNASRSELQGDDELVATHGDIEDGINADA